jgi:ABC-type transport system involved in multi-copper enzyme maturation permease subunit
VGGNWLAWGSPSLLLALGFLAAYARHETDAKVRGYVVNGFIGGTGLVLALIGAIGGYLNEGFLVTQGLASLLLGMGYLATFVGMQEHGSDYGYYGGWLITGLGAVMFVVALGRSAGPPLLHSLRVLPSIPPDPFFVPSGLVLMYIGLEYLILGILITSDRPLAVLTRREMTAFFCSPIAYVVIIGTALVGWYLYIQWTSMILRASENFNAQMSDPIDSPLQEPIIVSYILSFFPIFCVVFIVPILTMRLLSEERRAGTLEVLLTAPVNETPVVLSKFFAALRIYMLAWYPWGLFLIAFRIEGGQEFDYRPLLSFYIALFMCGVGFLAMGLFFSALTRNQIAAAILTFVCMLFLTFVYWIKLPLPQESPVRAMLKYVSYVDLWIDTLNGTLAPKYLIYHASAGIFWLFLTVKVLESRKWS